MGNLSSSSYQEVKASSNGKWLILVKSDAYINICSVAFFVVSTTDNGYRITFKLVDNDKSHDGGQPLSKIETTEMSREEVDDIISALLKK